MIDAHGDINETDESDNIFEMNFFWNAEKWPALYNKMLGDDCQEEIHLLRNFRDKVLMANKRSKAHVDILYKNSAQIALLLLKDGNLKIETAGVIEQLLPEIASLLEGEETVISSRMVTTIETLLDKYEVKAGPGVKLTIRKLKKEIEKGEFFDQLGIKVE